MKAETINRTYKGLTLTLIAMLGIALIAKLAFGSTQRANGYALIESTLADTPSTGAIDMCPTGIGNCYDSITFTVGVDVGTTTDMTVVCYQSYGTAGTTPNSAIIHCDGSNPSNCAVHTLAFDVSGGDTIVSFTITEVGNRYISCTFDDAADGTGEVDVTTTLTKQTGR